MASLTWQQKVEELQQIPNRIRNICILAHVDHGKTTLSDCLISSNHIISAKTAGTMRYLDSREDEQQRQITMKASSIGLIYTYTPAALKQDDTVEEQHHFINLIDSPGHVDFSVEVNSAVVLSDGALVLIDCVEGVSPQTQTVIRQAWHANIKTCLVLNKLDRLMIEKQQDADQIYLQLWQIIEQANTIIAELIQGDFLKQEGKTSEQDVEKAELEHFYSPEKGNVAFASAYDNWAFTLSSFAPKIAKQLGMNPNALKKFLWGKYYYKAAEKKIVKQPPSSQSQEMFVQFVLQPLVNQYRKVFTQDLIQTNKVKAHMTIKELLSKAMPVDKAIFSMVVENIPSPVKGQKFKVNTLSSEFVKNTPRYLAAKTAIAECSANEPLVIFVAKMQPFSARLYDVTTRSLQKSPSMNRLVAIARVLSGQVSVGQSVFVLGPNHTDATPDITETVVEHLFLLMGSCFNLIPTAKAGCIIGIGGLDDILIKSGTITSDPQVCPNFLRVEGLSMGLVKVSIEPEELAQHSMLIAGLQKLNRADPSVEYYVTKQGEHILSTCGEVHLEKCLKDLKDDYLEGQINFTVGEPIIPFKETCVNRSIRDKVRKVSKEFEQSESSSSEESAQEEGAYTTEESKDQLSFAEWLEKQKEKEDARETMRQEQVSSDMYLEKIYYARLYRDNQKEIERLGIGRGNAHDVTANQKLRIKVKAVGLDFDIVAKWLEGQKQGIKALLDCIDGDKEQLQEATVFVREFRARLIEANTDKLLIRLINEHLQAFGPKQLGNNLLVNRYLPKEESILGRFDQLPKEDDKQVMTDILTKFKLSKSEFNNGILNGFNIATLSGPLCEEQIQGCCFLIQQLVIETKDTQEGDTYGPFIGQVISTVKDLCKRALLNAEPRLMEAVYLCNLLATPENYGIVYGLINKCRGKVVSEELQEGTNFFILQLVLPLVESFVFNAEIRKRCQGIAYPQLVFDGFQINTNDPFFIPKTEEELEDHGEGDILPTNPAKVLIEQVRVRKGLLVDKKIVGDGDKQRTISKKK